MKNPLATVVITCYNYAEYVTEAIESVLKQTYPNTNLIIINDGSIDNSLEIINSYKKHASVKIISRENKGIVYTRNQGLKLAGGEYLFFLDADDFFSEDYIEKMVAVAEESKADVVYPNWHVFGDEEYTKTFPEFTIQGLIRQEIHCTSESLIRLSSVDGHRFTSEKIAEDWDFFLGMALSGKKFVLAEDCYINYRVRSNTRGTTHPYWEDVYSFYDILKKWNKRYPDIVNPVDLPIYAGKIRDAHIASQDSIIQSKNKSLQEKDTQIAEKDMYIQAQAKQLEELNKQNERINTSYEFRVGKKLVGPLKKIYHTAQATKRSHKDRSGIVKRSAIINAHYQQQLQALPPQEDASNKIAVVIHLFYTDNWTLFSRKLALLPKDSFDLFVTFPVDNTHFMETVRKEYPQVAIIESPNRGRDVLPFMNVLRYITRAGYRTVLKFHSKKSTHRDDGQEWLETMLNQIIPEDKKLLKKLIGAIKADNFGVLGPADVYYPLTINFPANGAHMTRIMADLFSKDEAREVLQVSRKNYGFFGGTMFWANVKAIEKLVKFNDAHFFEEEAGQIDATFAHALERLFCVIPEVLQQDIYESDGVSVRKRPYRSETIPVWSEDHDK